MRAHLPALAAVALLAAALAHAEPPARYDGRLVVRAVARTADDLDLILRTSADVWSHRLALGPVDCMVDAQGLETLRAAGLSARVLIPDVQRAIAQERATIDQAAAARGLDWFFDYHPYAEFSSYADDLVALRPDICSRLHVGTSLEGREIFALRITGPGADPGRPAAFFNACQHAREWISAATAMYIADRLVRDYDAGDESAVRMVDNVEFLIVPVVNPDGYEFTWTQDRLWRKNRRANYDGTRGVDLNRNWGHQWGGPGSSVIPSTNVYAGPGPFSEPETQALRAFLEARTNVRAAIDFHSYGQLVMSPWAWTTSPAPDAPYLNQLASDMADAYFAQSSQYYQPGPVGQILYLAAGSSSDWIYAARDAFAFGIELRDTGEHGFVLPASEIRPTGEETFAAMRVLADRLIEPAGPFTLLEPADGAPAVPSSPLLRWSSSASAARYEVVVSESPDLSAPVYTRTLSAEQILAVPASALAEGGRYWWTVRAIAPAGPRDASSSPRSFRVRARADVNLDGVVNTTDVGILIGSWGPCAAGPCAPDLNRDGRVDSTDLALLLAGWG